MKSVRHAEVNIAMSRKKFGQDGANSTCAKTLGTMGANNQRRGYGEEEWLTEI